MYYTASHDAEPEQFAPRQRGRCKVSAVPHIGQTVRQRRDLRVLRGAAAYAEHQHYTDPGLRWEMERAARTELLPVEQPEPALFCAPVEDEPRVTLAEAVSIIAKGFACIAGWLAFGFGVLWLCDLAGQFFGSNV